AVGVPLTIDDFDRVRRRTPRWADLKPGGRFTAVDLGHAGGSGVVARRLVAAGLADGAAVTATGRTFAEEAARAVERAGQEVVRPLEQPLKPTGGLVILRGNLAPEGCVVKMAGHERLRHRGPARVFEREEDAMAEATLRERLARWRAPAPRYTSGVFAKYVALVSSAAEGAVTRPR